MKIFQLSACLFLLLLFSCQEQTPKVTKKNTDLKTTDLSNVQPSEFPVDKMDVVDFYNLSEKSTLPQIRYHKTWRQWIAASEGAEAEFSDFQSYQEEYPFEILVNKRNGYLSIKDPGTGGGIATTTAALFKKADGTYLFACNNTSSSPESTDSKLSFEQLSGHDNLKDVTKEVFPEITADKFFSDKKETALEHPLISILYELPQNGTTIEVQPSANYPFACKNGKLMVADLKENEIDEICKTWKFYSDKSLSIKWDKEKGGFN